MELDIITNEKIKEVSALLQVHVGNWLARMAHEMSVDKEWKEQLRKPCPKSTVYQLSAGNVESNLKRRIFLRAATKLIEIESRKSSGVLEVAEVLIEKNAKN